MRINKSTWVALLALGLPFAAQAQSQVTIYGTLRVSMDSIKADGATAGANVASRLRVTDNDSALGFRGVEDLGGGLKAFFQLESAVRPDGMDNAGAGTPSFLTRNSGVGLRGNWGEFMMGRWDTYDNTHEPIADRVGGKAGQVAKIRAVFSKYAGTQVSGRLANVLMYTSPSFSGFQARATYSAGPANEVKTGNADEAAWALSLTYNSGPFGVNYAYFRHQDVGNVATLDRVAHKLAGGYEVMPGTRIGLLWERIEMDNFGASLAVAGANNGRRNAWGLTLAHQIGAHGLHASYADAKDGSGTAGATGVGANTGARYYQLTWTYDLSKRTNLHATWAKVANRSAGLYDFHSNGAVTGIAAGSDPQAIQVGIVHAF